MSTAHPPRVIPAEQMANAQDFLNNFVPYHLYRVTSRATALALEDYREFGVSVPEARLLLALRMGSEIAAGELSTLLSVEASLLSHMLRHLTTKGLIVRKRDPVERRSIRVSLTAKGLEIATQCRDISARHQNMLLDGLSADERAQLLRLLDRLYNNVSAHAAEQK